MRCSNLLFVGIVLLTVRSCGGKGARAVAGRTRQSEVESPEISAVADAALSVPAAAPADSAASGPRFADGAATIDSSDGGGAGTSTRGGPFSWWGEFWKLVNEAKRIASESEALSRDRSSFWNSRNWYNDKVHKLEAATSRDAAAMSAAIATLPVVRKEEATKSAELQAKTSRVANLGPAIADARSKANEAIHRLATAKAQLTDAANAHVRIARTLDEHRAALAQAQASVSRFSSSVAAQREGALQNAVTAAQRDLDNARTDYKIKVASMRTALDEAKTAHAAATADRDAANAELATQHARAVAADSALAKTRSLIANARADAEKLALSVLSKAKQASADADASLLAATQSLQAAQVDAAVANALVQRRSAHLKSELIAEDSDVSKWKAALTTLTDDLQQLRSKGAADMANFTAALNALTVREDNKRSRLASAAGKLRVAMAARAQEIAFYKAQVDDAVAAHAASRNHSIEGLAVIRAERAALELALAHAVQVQDASIIALSTVGARLNNRTRDADTAAALLRAQRATSEAAFKDEEAQRVSQVAALQEAIAAAGARVGAVSAASMEEQSTAAKLLVQQSDAARDAAAERANSRAAESRTFESAAAGLRAGVAAARADVDALLDRRAAAKSEVAALAQQLLQAQDAAAAAEKERVAIADAVAALQRKRADLRAAADDAAARTAAAASDIDFTQAALDDASKELRAAAVDNAGVERRVAALRSAVSAAEAQLREAGRASAALGADMERVRTVQATIDRLSAAVSDANKRLDAADTAKAALTEQVADLTTRKAAAEATVADLQARLDQRKALGAAGVVTGSDAELKAAASAALAAADAIAAASSAKVAAISAQTADVRKRAEADAAAAREQLFEAEERRRQVQTQLAAVQAATAAKSAAAGAAGTSSAAEAASADAVAAAQRASDAAVAALARDLGARVAALGKVVGDLAAKQREHATADAEAAGEPPVVEGAAAPPHDSLLEAALPAALHADTRARYEHAVVAGRARTAVGIANSALGTVPAAEAGFELPPGVGRDEPLTPGGSVGASVSAANGERVSAIFNP